MTLIHPPEPVHPGEVAGPRRRDEPRAARGRRAQPEPDRAPPVLPAPRRDGGADPADPDRRSSPRPASDGDRSRAGGSGTTTRSSRRLPTSARRCRCDRTWLGGAGIQIGDHPVRPRQPERPATCSRSRCAGVQQTLVVIVVLAVMAVTIGVTIGALSGYYGRWVDSVLMRLTDVVLVIPLLLIAAVASFAFDLTGIWSVALALGLFTWPSLSRLVRAEFLALREREFVDAARVAGASNRRVILKHILPNTVGTIVVSSTLLAGRRHPRRSGARLPRFRHPVAGRTRWARWSSQYQGVVLDPPVAVHLARRLHRGHRAVPAVRRRRVARRVRPAPEAHPQAQGPRSVPSARRRPSSR